MAKVRERIEGVVIGVLMGFDGAKPLVVFAGNPKETALPARSLVELSPEALGAEVALLFEGGNPAKPLIVGRIVAPARKAPGITPEVIRDGERVTITGQERVELRCGKARIILEKDGRITIRGTYVTSHASAANRIRGGSVNLN
ncbi:DUF6484 domain-containing protein [Chelativorans salis]|uniref:DUF6484 domain-containing protein n=1 Tax=Chelativorans salis TaxID=2978478 RepID=A0ABT2LHU8_9HYPH|nr:DUF6484 domain-containing protein [Chelativorans sp. EGI FJ00035]MCT7374152.1 DUF6484 domain-containing protein [Chelativorans sp. EGI FJ00035]